MKEIQKKQNEEPSLIVQYAARYYFNKAEKFNVIAWCLCLISFFLVLIPMTMPEIVVYGISFLVDIIAFVIVTRFNKYVSLGAQLREIFDNYIFGFSDKLLISPTLKEYELKAINKNLKQADIQKRNNANDDPPGVRDWYNTDFEASGMEAIFICQKENTFWEKKLIPLRIALNISFATLIIVIFWIMISVGCISIWQVLLSSALVIRVLERIVINAKYIKISNEIDGIVKVLEFGKTQENIKKLQLMINQKRNLSVVGINFIHKSFAKKLSVLYDKLND